MLEQGRHVRVAESAAEGMAPWIFGPQVLLCDIAMPGEDGYAFIRRVRARGPEARARSPRWRSRRWRPATIGQRALAAGFQLHLAKPIDIDRLGETP